MQLNELFCLAFPGNSWATVAVKMCENLWGNARYAVRTVKVNASLFDCLNVRRRGTKNTIS